MGTHPIFESDFDCLTDMNKEILREGSGMRAHDYWQNAAEANFIFVVYRETGEILDDSASLCSQMDPPGTFKMLMEKKFKVEVWEKYLRTMRKGEKARFHSDSTEHCVQYANVSKMLRDIKLGRKAHGCMGALAGMGSHGHSHGDDQKDEVQELITNPEELTSEFELLDVIKKESHDKEVWAMNKSEQKESAPKFKEEGKQLFLDKKYDQAGVSYEKAL